MNAFDVLGVPTDATPEQIRAAYKRLARDLHPDRHVRDDGTVPAGVHELFCTLNQAVDVALKTRSVPEQRPVATPAPARRPARFEDAVLALLTVPRFGSHRWRDDHLELWALTLVPAARRHEQEARRLAVEAGATTVHQQTLAAAHALLSLTLASRTGARLRELREALPAAYDVLEADLPATVVARLPRKVLEPRTRRSRLFG